MPDKTPIMLRRPISGVQFGYLLEETTNVDGKTLYLLDMGKFQMQYGTRGGFRIVQDAELDTLKEVRKAQKEARSASKALTPPKVQGNPTVGKKKCICGMCEEWTGGNFAPGHDSKSKARLNRVLSGEDQWDIPAGLRTYISKKSKWMEKYGDLL